MPNRSKKSLIKRLSDLDYTSRSDKDVSAELINAAEKMQSLDSKSIGIEVGEALIPIFSEIRTELQSLREFKADRGQDILKELREEFILPISEQLKESASSTKEASEAVISLKNELGSVSEKLAASIVTIQDFQGETLSQQLSQNMGAQVNNLERSYRSLNTRYEESLRIGNEQLSEYFQRAIVHEQKFFEEADSSTAKLCNTLLKAADYLVATEKSRRQDKGDN